MSKSGKSVLAVFLTITMLVLPIMAFPSVSAADDYDFREDFNYITLADYLRDAGVSVPDYGEFLSLKLEDSALAATVIRQGGRDVKITKPLGMECSNDAGVFDMHLRREDGAAFTYALLSSSYDTVAEVEVLPNGTLCVNGQMTSSELPAGVESILRIRFSDATAHAELYDSVNLSVQELAVVSAEQNPAFYRITIDAESKEGAAVYFRQLTMRQSSGSLPFAEDDKGGYDAPLMDVIYEDAFDYDSVDSVSSGGYQYSGNGTNSAADGEIQIIDGYPALVRKNADGGRAILTRIAPRNVGDLNGRLRAEFSYEVDLTKKTFLYYDLGFAAVNDVIDENEKGDQSTRFVLQTAGGNLTFNFTAEDGNRRDLVFDIDYDRQIVSVWINGTAVTFADGTQSTAFRTASQSWGNLAVQNRGLESGRIRGSEGSMMVVKKYKLLRSKPAYELLTGKAESLTSESLALDITTVTEDLSLPDMIGDVPVHWSSDNPEVISSDGRVTRPEYESERVVLTAALEMDGAYMRKTFAVTVLGRQSKNYYFLNSDTALQTGSEWTISGMSELIGGMVALSQAQAQIDIECKEDIGLGGKAVIAFDWCHRTGDAEITINGGGKPLLTLNANEGTVSLNDAVLPLNLTSKQSVLLEMNLFNGTADIFANGNLLAQNVPLNGSAVTIDSICVKTSETTMVGNPKGYNLCEELPAAMLSQIGFEQFTSEQASQVKRDLNIPTSPIAEVTYQFKSDNPAITAEGKVARAEGDSGGNLILTAVYTEMGYSAQREYFVTVPGISAGNIAYSKTVSANVSPASGSALSDLTDDETASVFRTRGSETGADFIIDLEESQTVGKIEIIEETSCIQEVQIAVSDDKVNWTTLYEGTPKNMVSYIGKGRYVGVFVTKKAAGEPLAIAEIIVRSVYTDMQAVRTDMRELRKGLPEAGNELQSFSVPKTGNYGAYFTLTADRNFVNVSEQADSYVCSYTLPQGSTAVVLTLTARKGAAHETLNLQYTVSGSGSNSLAGGGSGGSSGGGSYGGTAMVDFIQPNSTTENQPPEHNEIFRDVNEEFWAKKYIEHLYLRGIISGNGNGSFEPERAVTREEFLKLLISALPIEKEETTVLPFTDVETDAWYYPYLQQAYAVGLTNGETETTFGIGKSVTREDIAVLTDRMLSLKNHLLPAEKELIFTDMQEVSEYAAPSVLRLSAADLINGYETGAFLPKGNATRAEAAKLLSVLISEVEK